MSARIVVLPFDRMRRAAAAEASASHPDRAGTPAPAWAPEAVERLQFWRGRSGRAYPHIVYSLDDCPPLAAAAWVLVRRDAEGRGAALALGRLAESAAAGNLAALRRLGTALGADEVHVHFPGSASADLAAVERDLASSGLIAAAGLDLGSMPAAGSA